MKTIKRSIGLLVLFTTITTMQSCTSVKGYQKVYLNDKEMELAARSLEYFCTNFQSYREGASGANGGKVGGGCGCN